MRCPNQHFSKKFGHDNIFWKKSAFLYVQNQQKNSVYIEMLPEEIIGF